MFSGIYRIVNIVNNHYYIGSTVNFTKRKREHFHSLRNNNHRNKYLQHAFNKYGESMFIFEIVEYCKKDVLLLYEQYYINLAQHEENSLYNLEKTVTRTLFMKPKTFWLGKKRSFDDIQKFKNSHTGLIGCKTGQTGVAGVSWNGTNGNYRVRITVNKKTTNLGHFKKLTDAISARKNAELTFPGIKREAVPFQSTIV